MKGILTSLYTVFGLTALITHIWTIIIAYKESGFFAAILSLFAPLLAEGYWMVVLYGKNNFYVVLALIHVLLVLSFLLFKKGKKKGKKKTK